MAIVPPVLAVLGGGLSVGMMAAGLSRANRYHPRFHGGAAAGDSAAGGGGVADLPSAASDSPAEGGGGGGEPKIDGGDGGGIPTGVLSGKDPSFFHALRSAVDGMDDGDRCRRYGWALNDRGRRLPAANGGGGGRRIYYGALVADEPWELLHAISAEVRGLYEAVVLVEGNRTQSFAPRPFRRLGDVERLKGMFGVEKLQVRAFVDENEGLQGLAREHAQRGEILKGWRELGMGPDDVGLLSDADETLTRDFLRAVRVCDGIAAFDYEKHRCRHEQVKLVAVTRVFESSPECVADGRAWFHPDVIVGHCIEGIGDESRNPVAPRTEGSFLRARGFGKDCGDWEGEWNVTDGRYPLWNAADFRRTCGGYPVANKDELYSHYTAFHFHNFFAQFSSTRFKYKTYGHPDQRADEKQIQDMSNDLKMMYRCVKNLADSDDQKRKRVKGGFDNIDPFYPIYFQDEDYRERRHQHVIEMVEEDERLLELHLKEKDTEEVKQVVKKALQSKPYFTKEETERQRRTETDTGVDLADRELYAGVDFRGDSSTTTVIALATNYRLDVYRRFVGSLRLSGFKGHIILGLHPNVSENILAYLHARNVTTKILRWVDCTYEKDSSEKEDIFKKTTCADPYPDIKIRWSRYPLARDWLEECETCTGPVLIMDARDSYFQLDPFGPGSPVVEGLQVFQEHVNMTTRNWLTHWPIKDCKGATYDEPMLCSGTTVGTRAAMLRYLTIMYEEMKVWINDPKCRFDINGDDQSIHNYLFYSGQLPFAHSIVNREGGIVNTIGHHAAQISKRHFGALQTALNATYDKVKNEPYPGANNKTWIGPEFGLTNEDGYLTEFDGSLSRVVHQYDRFGLPFIAWLQKQPLDNDEVEQHL
jgi:hypothetical protein